MPTVLLLDIIILYYHVTSVVAATSLYYVRHIINKAIRDGKYLARHMPVLGNVHPIKIENFDIFS